MGCFGFPQIICALTNRSTPVCRLAKDLHLLFVLCIRARFQPCHNPIHKLSEINQRGEAALKSRALQMLSP
jgi:hypothetical protein